jgi:valyl-tRNA synthetase
MGNNTGRGLDDLVREGIDLLVGAHPEYLDSNGGSQTSMSKMMREIELKEKLLKEVANSYNEIVSPSREKVRVLLDKLTEANQKQTNPEIRESIASLRNMLRTLDNIESNWNISNIKAVLELTGESYSGQVGIIEKAMEEVSKTSDIKEKQDDLEEEASEEDVTMKVKSFEDNASLTESGKSKTSYRLRRFMSGIKRVNADGSVIKGFLGLPSYVNYNEVYDTHE